MVEGTCIHFRRAWRRVGYVSWSCAAPTHAVATALLVQRPALAGRLIHWHPWLRVCMREYSMRLMRCKVGVAGDHTALARRVARVAAYPITLPRVRKWSRSC